MSLCEEEKSHCAAGNPAADPDIRENIVSVNHLRHASAHPKLSAVNPSETDALHPFHDALRVDHHRPDSPDLLSVECYCLRHNLHYFLISRCKDNKKYLIKQTKYKKYLII